MARRMMVATAVVGLAVLTAAPAIAQESLPPDEEIKLERPQVWINGWEFIGGDGDNVPEPGERLQLWIDLSQGGEDVITDISGTLRSLTDEVRVLEGSSTWANLSPGENGRSRVAFEIKVTEDAKIQEAECPPMMIDPLPVEEPPAEEPPAEEPPSSGDGDDPVSSDGGTVQSDDGTVSSDGTVDPDGTGGGEPGDAGQTGPSSGDGTATPEEIEAEQAEREKLAAEETTTEETVVEEPIDSDGREPAPVDYEPGVHISLALDVTSSAGEQELFIDNGMFCAYTTELGGATGDDDAPAARDVAMDGADEVASVGRAPAIASASVLLGAMALILGSVAWRRRAQML